jgi:DNA-binding transcriptional LysR family regulator
MVQLKGAQTAGIEFELLRTYPLCVAVTPAHPFARLKSVPLQKVAAEPVIGLCRRDFPEYYRNLNRIFASIGAIGSFPPTVLEIATPEWQSLIKFGLYTGQRLRPHRSHEGKGETHAET